MIQTETSKAKILFVEVPKTSGFYKVEGSTFTCDPDINAEMCSWRIIPIPHGNWQILNTLKDVSEEEAEIVVESFVLGFKFFRCYHTTENGKKFVIYANKSLHSIAQSLNLDAQKNYVILYELKK